MEFCGMKREIDRKCFIHARVHANAQSFDRCEYGRTAVLHKMTRAIHFSCKISVAFSASSFV